MYQYILAIVLLVCIVPQAVVSSNLAVKDTGAGCKCNSTLCACCVDVDLPVIQQSVCAQLVWLQERYSISVRIVWNSKILFERVLITLTHHLSSQVVNNHYLYNFLTTGLQQHEPSVMRYCSSDWAGLLRDDGIHHHSQRRMWYTGA